MKIRNTLPFLAIVSLCLSSCNTEESDKQAVVPIMSTDLPEPFRYHKAIEVKPGLTFDVFSWGRGSKYVGAYLVLRSDSTRSQYRSTTGELEGEITDVWNMDMDSDGNTELFIQAKGQDEGSYLKMYVYEFSENGSAQELRFPELTSSSKKNYRGKDSVYIKDGDLLREYPLFEEADTAATKPTGKKVLKYTLRGNSFSVKEVKEEQK